MSDIDSERSELVQGLGNMKDTGIPKVPPGADKLVDSLAELSPQPKGWLQRAKELVLGKPLQPGEKSLIEEIDKMENETTQQRAARHDRDMNSPKGAS